MSIPFSGFGEVEDSQSAVVLQTVLAPSIRRCLHVCMAENYCVGVAFFFSNDTCNLLGHKFLSPVDQIVIPGEFQVYRKQGN